MVCIAAISLSKAAQALLSLVFSQMMTEPRNKDTIYWRHHTIKYFKIKYAVEFTDLIIAS